MSVYYRLKTCKDYVAVKFDGVYISVSDLKSTIVQQQKLGNSDVQIQNEESGQIYSDDQQIPKNTNVIVMRLPFANSNKRTRASAHQPYPQRFSGNSNSSGTVNSHYSSHNNRNHNHHHQSNHHGRQHHSNFTNSVPNSSSATTDQEALELVSNKTMSEEDKIKHIQSQSTRDFDLPPSRSLRGFTGRGRGGYRQPVGPGYTCKKCFIPGHSIYECKMTPWHKVKRSSGIPRDFLKKADPKEKGALMTPSGEYAVPYIDHEAYSNPKIEKAPFFEDGTPDVPTPQ